MQASVKTPLNPEPVNASKHQNEHAEDGPSRSAQHLWLAGHPNSTYGKGPVHTTKDPLGQVLGFRV